MDWCAQDAFCINVGKIYGIMDDLRTESSRVQEKHIAAAKSLIASTDIDFGIAELPDGVESSGVLGTCASI